MGADMICAGHLASGRNANGHGRWIRGKPLLPHGRGPAAGKMTARGHEHPARS